MREFRFTVTKEDEGLGVKKLLRKHFDFSSRLFAKLKAQRRVLMNGEPIQGWMVPREGDVVVAMMPEEVSHFPEEDIPGITLYEDQDLLIINKPAGYTVHPTHGHQNHTMANGLQKYMRESGETYKIRFVNRLDMDTSGLLVIGKNSHAQDEMVRAMKSDRVRKYYKALVIGEVNEDEFTIDLPIGKPSDSRVQREVMPAGQGRPSVTHVKVLERLKGYTLVMLRLETGRTHQIRVHLSHIGYPILGDYLYGGDDPRLMDRQALHAFRLEFPHPVTREPITVEAPLPDDIQTALEKIRAAE